MGRTASPVWLENCEEWGWKDRRLPDGRANATTLQGRNSNPRFQEQTERHFKVDSMQNYLRNVIRKESSAHWLTLKSLMSTNILYPGELLWKMYSLQATAGCMLWQWSMAPSCRFVFCSAASTRQSSCLSGTDMPGCSWAQTWWPFWGKFTRNPIPLPSQRTPLFH